jgi:hypothetical protein
MDALLDAGADLTETTIEHTVNLEIPPEILQVNSTIVYVYEYESVDARIAVSESMAVDGTSIDEQLLSWPDRINIWASERIIVAYPGIDGATIMLLNGLLGDPINQPPAPVDEPFPPAVTAAVGYLAERINIDPGDVEVTGFTAETWPDACLGLPEEGEWCDQVMVPGWEIMMSVGEDEFVVHSNQIGEYIRLSNDGN